MTAFSEGPLIKLHVLYCAVTSIGAAHCIPILGMMENPLRCQKLSLPCLPGPTTAPSSCSEREWVRALAPEVVNMAAAAIQGRRAFIGMSAQSSHVDLDAWLVLFCRKGRLKSPILSINAGLSDLEGQTTLRQCAALCARVPMPQE